MTEETFLRDANDFVKKLLRGRLTDNKYAFAVFAVLFFAVKAGRTQEMYSLIAKFAYEVRSGDDDWPDWLSDNL